MIRIIGKEKKRVYAADHALDQHAFRSVCWQKAVAFFEGGRF